jgi:hypothetical protein
MTKGTHAVCIPLYFKDYRTPQWVSGFIQFAEDAAQQLGIRLTHFMCDYEGKRSLLRERQMYRFSDRNKARLYAMLDYVHIISLGFYQYSDNVYQDAVIDMAEMGDYKRLYMECATETMEMTNLVEQFDLFASLVAGADRIVDIAYGLVTRMRVIAPWAPSAYFVEIKWPGINANDELNLEMWHRQRDDFRHKARGVYWGNLLSRGHLQKCGGIDQFYPEIEALVGPSRVQRFGDEKVFFMLPDMEKTRQAIEELFERNGVLMHPAASLTI